MEFNATNKTPHYGLPLFTDSDKPSWLVDWNGAMAELDTALQAIASGEETNSNLISTATENISKIKTTIEEMKAFDTTLTNRVVTLEGTTNRLDSEYNTVLNDLQNQNRLILQLQEALNTFKNETGTDFENVNNSITELNTKIDTVKSSIDTEILDLKGAVIRIDSSVDKNSEDIAHVSGLTTIAQNTANTAKTEAETAQSTAETAQSTANSTAEELVQVTNRIANIENEQNQLVQRTNLYNVVAPDEGTVGVNIKTFTHNFSLQKIVAKVYLSKSYSIEAPFSIPPLVVYGTVSDSTDGIIGTTTNNVILKDGATETITVTFTKNNGNFKVAVSQGSNYTIRCVEVSANA